MYEKRFQSWIDMDVTAETIEQMYADAMAKIKEDPSRKAVTPYKADPKYKKQGKLSLADRKERVALKKAAQVRLQGCC